MMMLKSTLGTLVALLCLVAAKPNFAEAQTKMIGPR